MITTARKRIELSAGVYQYQRFADLMLRGAVIDDQAYNFDGCVYQNDTEYTSYKTVYGEYSLSGYAYNVRVTFYFYKDGRFLVAAQVYGPGSYDLKLPLKIEYDLNGSANDIFEFSYNDIDSSSPPQGEALIEVDGVVVFSESGCAVRR